MLSSPVARKVVGCSVGAVEDEEDREEEGEEEPSFHGRQMKPPSLPTPPIPFFLPEEDGGEAADGPRWKQHPVLALA